jgi:hypothetical protein
LPRPKRFSIRSPIRTLGRFGASTYGEGPTRPSAPSQATVDGARPILYITSPPSTSTVRPLK